MPNKRLYAMPTNHCNLTCDHCSIKNRSETYDRDKFLLELNRFEGDIILFGGEVTTHLDRMFDIIESNNKNGKSKIGGVSTNLLILNDKLIEFYKKLGGISTSWNPSRFKPNEYEIWKKNCKILNDNDIRFNVMITLTNDLFELTADEFLSIASEWTSNKIYELKFEHYVGDENTPEYFERADDWLCELYKKWNLPFELEILNRINCWDYNCNDVYTLHPDGRITNGCPHTKNSVVVYECYDCDKVDKCRPCRLQAYCSYPKKLAKLISEHTKEDE